MFHRFTLAAALAAACAIPAIAHHDGDTFRQAGIVVSHAHTVEVSAKAHAIDVFMTIENTGDSAVVLTGAEIDFAAPGVFQAPSVGEDGKLSVREISSVEIAPGQTLTMQPSGLHVVFNDVQRALQGGDHFHAHLEFEGLGEMEIEVDVEHADDHYDHDAEMG